MDELFEYLNTACDPTEWADFEADMATDPYDDEEWPDDLWEPEDVGFDPYMGCYTDDC